MMFPAASDVYSPVPGGHLRDTRSKGEVARAIFFDTHAALQRRAADPRCEATKQP